jgi:uroporphyrinogen III methyltransferase/synthase
MTVASPLVFLVGAGPGNPGLLTLRAVECLAQANLIVYDQLVPARLLDHVPAAAECICVTALGSYAERGPRILTTMIEAVRQGKCVVRLKGGDPFVFGRGAEEAAALREAGIPCEIVPGVTAGLGASAFAGIPLTHRSCASAVAFITGHEDPNKDSNLLDWSALARFPGTLVFYMAMARLDVIAAKLLTHGKAPDTPTAVIHRATTAAQRTLTAPLSDVAAAVRAAGITSPAIVVAGPVVNLRESLQWFEQRPLFGKRVLVTRPRNQAGRLARKLEELGATVAVLPAVALRDPSNWSLVDNALGQLGLYQWLVFTSANGVHAFLHRLLQTGRDLRALGSVRLAVIGPSTAEALRSYNLEPDVIPSEYCSESLAAALKERTAGQRVLLARADRGRDLLREELAKTAQVDQVAVYCQSDVLEADAAELTLLRTGEIDYITLTSSYIAGSLARALDTTILDRIESGVLKIVTISPVTSQTVRELGLPVAAEASTYTTDGLVNALIKLAVGESELRKPI